MYVPLQGFAPDADPTTPGVITDCDNIYPTLRGIEAAPTGVTSHDTLSEAAQNAFQSEDAGGTRRLFVGAVGDIYVADDATQAWTNIATGLTDDGVNTWQFAQYGNITLCNNRYETPQQSTSGAACSALAAMPKAYTLDTVGEFVIVGNTTEGTYGDQKDRWWTSALGDYTDWTPSISTECVTGRLTDSPGIILRVRKLNDDCVVYKLNSMYLLRYVGPPVVWAVQLVNSKVGLLFRGAVAVAGSAHYFMGVSDFYVYDGTVPRSIGDGVKDWFFAQLNVNYNVTKCKAVHDAARNLVIWYYVSTATTTLDKWIAYNYKTGKWGYGSLAIETAYDFLTRSVTQPTGIKTVTAYVGYINTSHVPKLLAGANATHYFTTGDVGDDENVTLLSRVKPRFTTTPATGSMVNYYKMSEGDSVTTDATTTMGSSRFDVLRSARYHRFKISGTGDMECEGINIDLTQDGEE